MRRTVSIARRELRLAFGSPSAYVAAIFFCLSGFAWFLVAKPFFAADRATLRGLFEIMPASISVLAPALAMRLWAEERRSGTAESLLSMPFSEIELVSGKFLGVFALLCAIVSLTLPVALLASAFGSFDPGQIAAEYCGVLLMGAASLSVGQFASSLSRNQMTAFVAGTLALAGLTWIGSFASFAGFPGALGDAARWISMERRFASFSKGLLDSRDVSYFLLVTATFLVATIASVRAGRRS